MATIKATFSIGVLMCVGYALWLAGDTLQWFAEQSLVLALLSLRVCVGLVVFLVVAAALYAFGRQRHEHNRQRDGAFALREYWLEPLPKRIANWLMGRPSARAVYDPNANISHGVVIHNAVYCVEPAAGWDRQLAYAANIEGTRRAQAIAPGDGVIGLPWFGGGAGRAGIANAATGRMLAGAYDKPPKPPVTIDAPPALPALPPPAAITPQEAVTQSRPGALVLGQTDAGEIVRWDMAAHPHLRFHGATRGAGKTNAVQVLAAAALKTGAHVVVFDPARHKDWGDFRHCAELVDASDPAALADGAARLLTIYHNRTRQLAEAGARDTTQMERPPQRIVVVVCEFGAQCEMARAEGIMADVEVPLLQLARKAAAAGIYLVFEDQVMEHWPRAMSGNAAAVIGQMPLYAAQACGFIPRRGLSTETFERGQFWFGGQLVRVPHIAPELRSLLADVPAPRHLVMRTPPWVGADGGRSTVPPFQGERGGRGQNTPRPQNVPVERNGGTLPIDEPGRWDDVVAAWFAANPQALTGAALGISDLARAMCRDNEGGDANYEAYKGRAHKLFHDFRASVRLPNGAKLGTDITGGA